MTLSDGRHGLLHRSEAPRGRKFELGEHVACRVKATEPRLALTLNRSEEELAVICRKGQKVRAVVTCWKPFGVVVDIGGRSSLLHRSSTELLPSEQVPWDKGDELQVRITSLCPKLEISTRTLHLRPVAPRVLLELGDANLDRLRCFHSKAALGEAMFGLGISFEEEEMPNGQKRFHLSSVFDVLSHEAFLDGVRKGVWKQKFSEFLPLALDEVHFAKARKVLERIVSKLSSGAMAEKLRSHGKSREQKEEEFNARITLDEYKKKSIDASKAAPASLPPPPDAPFTPTMLLDLLPKLMNSQVVLISSGQLWRSQKALEGYFAYHHLLLHCLRVWPKLRTRMEKLLSDFAKDPAKRRKDTIPNLGEFLCLVSVSDEYGWQELGIPLLEEAFTRNALWVLRQAPKLGELTDAGVSLYRLRKTFQANLVSLRLLMFQVAFLQLVKAPHKHAPDGPTCCAASCALARKDQSKGLPGPGEAEWLFQRCVRILAVEDWQDFLELVGMARMDDLEICQWLRRSILSSIRNGYHNSQYFSRLALPKQKQKDEGGGHEDPEDFGMDTRPKEGKAEKRRRREALLRLQAQQQMKSREFERALAWARWGGGYTKRQALVIISDESELDGLNSDLDKDKALKCWRGGAMPGWRLLDKPSLKHFKSFPAYVWFGLGCSQCDKLVQCEISGRCYSCCVCIAKEPAVEKPIKGVTAGGGPVASFTAFQAMAVVNPLEFEMQFEVKFAGLVADVSPLRACLNDDLTVKSDIHGIITFSRVSRQGRMLWEKAPEQIMVPGSKLVAGWQGVTDHVLSVKVRNVQFVLLQDTMHNMKSLEDLDLLKMVRTSCKDHVLRDEKTKELIWNRPCKNCTGVLRLRFTGPKFFAERKAQLEKLNADALAQRAFLCGLGSEIGDAEKKKNCINHIIKSEKIIR